ncbi:MAG: GNAT family protein [Chloroflexota bacterium]
MFVLPVDDEIELRLHDMHNIERFYSLIDRNRDFIGQWMEWAENYKSVDDAYQYILWVREQFAQSEQIATQIYYKGEMVGSVALTIHDSVSGFAEVGYWLDEAYTGNGIITRSAHAMTNYAFNILKLHKVIIRAISDNTPSIAVAKRLGYQFQGLQIQQRLLRGTYYDYSVHYMLRNMWTDTTSCDFQYRVTDNIVLRPIMKHHIQDIFKTVDSHRNQLRQWVDWVDGHHTLDDTKNYIVYSLQHYGDYDGLDCGIWVDDVFVGQVNFNSWSLRNYKADLGYWLAPPFRGRGIMTHAVRAMIKYGFEVVGLHRIELLCALENEKSCAIAERLGFTHEGIMQRGERIGNQYYDVNVYALLKLDWQSQTL